MDWQTILRMKEDATQKAAVCGELYDAIQRRKLELRELESKHNQAVRDAQYAAQALSDYVLDEK